MDVVYNPKYILWTINEICHIRLQHKTSILTGGICEMYQRSFGYNMDHSKMTFPSNLHNEYDDILHVKESLTYFPLLAQLLGPFSNDCVVFVPAFVFGCGWGEFSFPMQAFLREIGHF